MDDAIEQPSATLPAGKYIRLKLGAALEGSNAADWFIRDLNRSPMLLPEPVQLDQGTVYLYGDEKTEGTPSYAAFIHSLTDRDVPVVKQPGYVLILEAAGEIAAWYAMTFGTGRYLLKDVIDIEAHRDIARQQTIPPQPQHEVRLKRLKTKEPGLTTLTNERRASRPSSLNEFDVDLETEILDDVFGRPQDTGKFGTGISGGQSLTIRTRISRDNIFEKVADFEAVLQLAQANEAETLAGMRTVKNADIIEALDNELAQMVRDADESDVFLSLPTYLDTDALHTIKFSNVGRNGPFADTVTLDDYRGLLAARGKVDDVDVAFLKNSAVHILSDDRKETASLYRCLGAHVTREDGHTYVHDDRSWYRVPADIQETVNEEIGAIDMLVDLLPAQAHPGTEAEYFEPLNAGDWLVVDRQLVQPFRGETRIEICDLLTIKDDQMYFVHVKRDFSSSQLSHLFNQGRVSALLMAQSDVRARYVDVIRQSQEKRGGPEPAWFNEIDDFLGAGKFTASRIKVVYAIIGRWPNPPTLKRLPFFSRSTLLKAKRELRGREYDVAVAPLMAAGSTCA